MPMIEFTAPHGTVPGPQRDLLMKRLTDTLLKWEGAAVDSAAAQSIAWAYFQEMPEGHLYVGGKPAGGEPRHRVKLTVPEGALNDERRAGLVSEIDAVLTQVLGAAAGGTNHWVLIREIQEGRWGVAGRIFRREDIVKFVRQKPGVTAGAA